MTNLRPSNKQLVISETASFLRYEAKTLLLLAFLRLMFEFYSKGYEVFPAHGRKGQRPLSGFLYDHFFSFKRHLLAIDFNGGHGDLLTLKTNLTEAPIIARNAFGVKCLWGRCTGKPIASTELGWVAYSWCNTVAFAGGD